jgi:selenocysteine-specific elongation factor
VSGGAQRRVATAAGQPVDVTAAGHRVVATAGHVDHGKSTLLRALTGMEPDRLAEEQRRGLTIDLGFVWTTLPPTAATPAAQTVAFVDVPGHERFVGTMLAGTGAAPAALFVVAANDGWSAQSSEHRDVLDLLGVPAAVRVVTKADTVPTDRVEQVVAEVADATRGTSLDTGPIVVTDAVTGRGLDALRTVLRDRLAALPPPRDVGRPRLWVDRSFPASGAGTVVTGKLTEGALHVGDSARLLPDGREVRIRRLQSLGEDLPSAAAGTRVAVNLVGVGHDEVARGDALVVGAPWRVTREVELWVRVLPDQRLDRTGAWRLHVGTAAVSCTLRPLTGPIEGGAEGAVRVRLDHPLPLVAGDRVVLREAGRRATVAGGVVAEPAPHGTVRGAVARKERADRLAAIARGVTPASDNPVGVIPPGLASAGATTDPATADAVRAARLRGLVALVGGSRDATEVRASAGWPADAPLPEDVVAIGPHLVLAEVRARWVAAVRTLGAGTHDRATVASSAGDVGAPESAAAALADHLVASSELVRTTHGVALPEHAGAAADARQARAEAVVAALVASPFAPPDLDELTRAHGLDHRERAALVASGAVVRSGKVAFPRVALDQAVAVLRRLEAEAGPFTASQAREALGTTRRFTIPLLEQLDRMGATSFDGQLRRVR